MKKIIVIIFFLSIYFLPVHMAIAQTTDTNCVWRVIYSVPAGKISCQDNEHSDSTTKCPALPPVPLGGFQTPMSCCCPGSVYVEPKAPTPPKFIMPELQISIPGLTLTPTSSIKYSENSDGSRFYQFPWLSEYILAIFNYGLSVAGILAAIVLMAGGVLWLVSSGDASKITQAKELILGSITGLIILSSSYIILVQINPNLIQLNPISIGNIEMAELANTLAVARHGSKAETYKNATCATDQELTNGIEFYATGYYKPAWENTEKFFCDIGMQCSCPNGDDRDTTKNCDFLYGKTYPGYKPCKYFASNVPYCNAMSSGGEPQIGDIAGPSNCQTNLPPGTKVCFKGKTYTIKDTGGGIKGRRIDIWSGNSIKDANANTGAGILKKGACN